VGTHHMSPSFPWISTPYPPCKQLLTAAVGGADWCGHQGIIFVAAVLCLLDASAGLPLFIIHCVSVPCLLSPFVGLVGLGVVVGEGSIVRVFQVYTLGGRKRVEGAVGVGVGVGVQGVMRMWGLEICLGVGVEEGM